MWPSDCDYRFRKKKWYVGWARRDEKFPSRFEAVLREFALTEKFEDGSGTANGISCRTQLPRDAFQL